MKKFNNFLENIGLRNAGTGENKPLGKIVIAVLVVLIVFLALLFGNKITSNLGNKKKTQEMSLILSGNQTMVVYINQQYNEPGFEATDEYGANINNKVTIIGEVDETTVGTYELQYKLSSNGKTLIKTRTVTVIDETKTAFVLKGEKDVKLKKGTIFEDPGYIIIVPGVTNPEQYITIDGTVDINKSGVYHIVYKYTTDTRIMELTRTVTVMGENGEIPTITLIGNQSVSLLFGSKYFEQGYNAFDDVDGDITSKVTVTNNIKEGIPGMYQVVYTVTNSRNITGRMIRNVKVLNEGESLEGTTSGKISDYLTIEASTTAYTRNDITLTINVVSEDYSQLILPNKTVTSSKFVKYNVSENGNYIFILETKNGQMISGQIEITNIDQEGPTGTCQSLVKNGVINYVVNASDTISGIEGYSYYNGSSYSGYVEETTYETEGNLTTGKINIKDKVGNTTQLDCSSEAVAAATSITIQGETKAVKNNQVPLAVVFTPSDVKNRNVKWEIVEGNSYGTINQNGVVTITNDAGVSGSCYIVVKATSEEGGLTATHRIDIYTSEQSLQEGASSTGSGKGWNGSIQAGLVAPNGIVMHVDETLNIRLQDTGLELGENPYMVAEDPTILSVSGETLKALKLGTTNLYVKSGSTIKNTFVISVVDPSCTKSAQHMTQSYQIGNQVGNTIVYGKKHDVPYEGLLTIGLNQVLRVTVSLTQKCGDTQYLTRTTADGEDGWDNYFEGHSEPFVNRYDASTFLKGQKEYDWVITAKKATGGRYISLSQTSFQATTVFEEIKSFGFIKVKVVDEPVDIDEIITGGGSAGGVTREDMLR